MKVLKHGKLYVDKQILTCLQCGCVFEADWSDSVLRNLTTKTSFICPECNSYVDVFNSTTTYANEYQGLINDLMYIEEERSDKNGND